jgi:molecular chaperone GrpE (heat shock protein)
VTAPDPAPDSTPAPAPDPVAGLVDAVALLREQLEIVHRRNDELLEQARSRADEPLIRDLVLIADAATRTARDWTDRQTAEPADVADALAAVADDLRRALARVGVEAFEPEPGTPFDRRTATVLRVESAANDEPGGRVVAVVRPGYRSGERMIRYAEVVVSRR